VAVSVAERVGRRSPGRRWPPGRVRCRRARCPSPRQRAEGSSGGPGATARRGSV